MPCRTGQPTTKGEKGNFVLHPRTLWCTKSELPLITDFDIRLGIRECPPPPPPPPLSRLFPPLSPPPPSSPPALPSPVAHLVSTRESISGQPSYPHRPSQIGGPFTDGPQGACVPFGRYSFAVKISRLHHEIVLWKSRLLLTFLAK
ncbi:hypothetical protein DBV15_07880 [Temnothorax longispinosus]|uniref:Uncharacterized protein n=1 Tax=Temnothorax longispinosus TaxID=300112 RepID=A0A4V3S6D9_9HYME|nr:hypothetical protein DBV15_07880 [Temnothorax longispinosus]